MIITSYFLPTVDTTFYRSKVVASNNQGDGNQSSWSPTILL